MIMTREQLEAVEAAYLAPYGMKSGASRGRKYPDAEHPYRTAFQRDRDRIIHTTAFRRLEFKTQVFVYTEGDYYRTRLTHTIEVAQIGRTLARALGANEDLTEAICLAHDLGHTPFGHSGEAKMNALMQNSGGFDHQAQSLRIVEELEERFPEHRGLNLTYEVREGIARHETEYDVANPAEYALNEAPTLEAQLTSAADEIAYSTADLDDGLRAGILDPRDLEELAVWEEWRAEKHMDMERFTDLVRHKFIRWLVNLLVSDLIAATDVNLRAFRIGSVAALRAHGKPVTAFSGTVEEKHRALKDFLYANFYRNYRVVRMAAKAERMLEALFHAYLNQPEILPPSVKARVSKLPPTRVVCDYIAGMTDRFAMNEYARLFDPETRV